MMRRASAARATLAPRACGPPGKSANSWLIAAPITYMTPAPPSIHTTTVTQRDRTVSMTSANLERRLSFGFEFREEHLLERELAAVELDDVARRQPREQWADRSMHRAAHVVALHHHVGHALDAADLAGSGMIAHDRLDPVSARRPEFLERAHPQQLPFADESHAVAAQLHFGQDV